jgi:hypothetical protein
MCVRGVVGYSLVEELTYSTYSWGLREDIRGVGMAIEEGTAQDMYEHLMESANMVRMSRYL